MFLFIRITAVALAFALTGCAVSRSPATESLKLLITGGIGSSVASSALQAPDLRYRYLRVEVDGYPPGLLVLGYIDPHPTGLVEVWFSGTQEALRTQNARVVGATGTLRQWSNVRWTPAPPSWTSVSAEGAVFVRQHDEMPGYRYGVTGQMRVQLWHGLPATKLPDSLPVSQALQYQWFRESAVPLSGQTVTALPDAWFAWGLHRGEETIVYSEQCLAPDFCLKLQRWPLMDEAN